MKSTHGFDDYIYLNQPSDLKITLTYLYHTVINSSILNITL